MRAPSLAVATIVAALASTCTRRVPEPTNLVPGTPHVTWVLMYGDRENADQEFACQSDPRTECVLPASRPDAQVFSDIHFYYHGAGAETRYEGTMTIGYLQGSPESHTTRTAVLVKKEESITNEAVTGIVTATPGNYTVTLTMQATVVDTGKTQPIRQTIQVAVK
jgi:hypothetical protein